MDPDGRTSTAPRETGRLDNGPGNHPRSGTQSATISQLRQEFLDLYHSSDVVIVTGEPGSGKTTRIPEFVLSEESNSGKRVASAQPQKTTTALLAERVAAKLDCEVGGKVGYNIPGDDRTTDETLLEFTTAEVLLWDLQRDGMLSRYSCIIIDEADQRTRAADILLMALKGLIPFRLGLKIVIICSDHETTSFLTYFDGFNVSTMTVINHNKPAIVQYCPELNGRVLADIVELVLEIEKVGHEILLALTPTGAGHILVVLATAKDVNLFCSRFESRTTTLEIVPLHEGLSIDDQRKVFIASSRQKCIVTTELIKNSFFVDGVTYVVDSGLIETKTFNHNAQTEVTSIEAVLKKNADRRAARAPSGVCFRLYTEATYEGLELQKSPELLRTSMTSEILLLKTLDYRRMDHIILLDPPSPAIVARGVWELETLGLVDDDQMLTDHGKNAYRCMKSDTPISPVWYKAIVEGFRYGVKNEMFCLAAIFNSARPIFIDTAETHASALGRFVSHQSDHLGYMHALYAYERVLEEEPGLVDLFCLESSLHRAALDAVVKFRDQLVEFFGNFRVGNANRPAVHEEARGDIVKRVLAKAFSHHAAFLDDAIHGHYKLRKGTCTATIKDTSCLAELRSKHVIFDKLACTTSNPQLEVVTDIKPEWLPVRPLLSF
ncbi:unnamed protein product [Clonostachys rosea]|uniref:RNA helicase n=1 Tax=Bionectria ochroleuca TaxID=29856 RepID=A0ABY6UHY7_BIOOC|nr:unnamed protein product [Clonostachys rosea]